MVFAPGMMLSPLAARLILLSTQPMTPRLAPPAATLSVLDAPPVCDSLGGQPTAAPGTTALRSPPGFEDAYAALRAYRASEGRPLVHIKQLERYDLCVASQLAERVNFAVPQTVSQAVRTFFAHPTARFISVAFAATATARRALGPMAPVDGFVALATGAAWCVQEWIIHDKLLHSARDWFGETVHRWHHELPYYHVSPPPNPSPRRCGPPRRPAPPLRPRCQVSLDGLGLAVAWFGAVGAAALTVGVASSALGPALSALMTYTLFGGLYEASHFLAHTRVPLPAALGRMRRHHVSAPPVRPLSPP